MENHEKIPEIIFNMNNVICEISRQVRFKKLINWNPRKIIFFWSYEIVDLEELFKIIISSISKSTWKVKVR